MSCGIYKITNKQNGKFYIGSSVNIKKRWYSHKSHLRNNVHNNSHLQNSWNKYGEENFHFIVLCEVEKEFLLETEQRYFNETKCYEKQIGYNKSQNADCPARGTVLSKEHKKKISLALKGRKHSEETKKKISEGNKGKIFSKETRKKMSDAKKGKIPKASKMPKSEKTRKKISDFAKTRTGYKNPNSRLNEQQIQEMRKDFDLGILTNGKIAEKYGVSISTIKRIKYGKTGYANVVLK